MTSVADDADGAADADARIARLGLLAGLEGSARAQREDLLRWLIAEGLTDDELRLRSERGTIVLAAASRALGGGNRFSARQLAKQGGVTVEFLRELQRAQGLPVPHDLDARDFSDVDLDSVRAARAFLDAGLSTEQLLATARVLGRGLARAAELMRQLAFELALSPGVTELELARAYSELAHQLTPMLGPMVETLLRLHLNHAVFEELVTDDEREAGAPPGARSVAVGFADLVGFTRMGETLGPDQLGRVAERLTGLTYEVVESPVRYVKSIGDAVLLVSPDPAALLHTAFALNDAAAAEGDAFPQLRVGVALGSAVRRAGDWFGPPVNLASRLTSVARAGSVLADAEVRNAVPDAVSWSYAGERQIQGVRRGVKLFRARPLRDPAPAQDPRAA